MTCMSSTVDTTLKRLRLDRASYGGGYRLRLNAKKQKIMMRGPKATPRQQIMQNIDEEEVRD